MFTDIQIKNIGIFKDAEVSELRKINIFYAENGLGKTTLSDIFQSANDDNNELINERKTLGVSAKPLVKLISSTGDILFCNDSWRNLNNCKFYVFNSDFVQRNIYSGNEINSDNRKNLLKFALGETLVNAKQELENLEEEKKNLSQKLKDTQKLFESMCKSHKALPAEVRAATVSDLDEIEEKINNFNIQLVKSKNSDMIKSRSLLNTELTQYTVEYIKEASRIESIVSKTFDNIRDSAKEVFQKHLQNFDLEPSWIKKGFEHIKNETCPLCNQDITGNILIEIYSTFFNEEYNKFIHLLDTLLTTFNEESFKSLEIRISDWITTQNSILKQWTEQEFSEISMLDLDEYLATLEKIFKNTRTLILEKKKNINSELFDSQQLNELNNLLDVFNSMSGEINRFISETNKSFSNYKNELDALQTSDILESIRLLEIDKIRSDAEISNLISEDLEISKKIKTVTNEIKDSRKSYNDEINNILGDYLQNINIQLQDLNAQFKLSDFKPNFRGSEERTEFTLQVQNMEVSTSGNQSKFRTSLSEGDKRTLSFAFFASAVLSDPNISEKIIVFDDPFTSLDSVRRKKTISKIIDISTKAKQVFIFTHDEYFAKSLFEGISERDRKISRILRGSQNFSVFSNVDIFRLCQSDYYNKYEDIQGFVESPSDYSDSQEKIAAALRPLLEGYLHRKFPTHLDRGKMVGTLITEISNDSSGFFPYSQETIATMREISEYSSQFHHITDIDSTSSKVYTDELLIYCQKTLDILHS